MAQSVERHLGKVEVAGSIPAISSIENPYKIGDFLMSAILFENFKLCQFFYFMA